MKFFHGCTSEEEAKKTYHKLAKCFHPDKGGSTELMTELTRQYETWNHPTLDHKPFQTFTPNNFGKGSMWGSTWSPGGRNMQDTFASQASVQINRLNAENAALRSRLTTNSAAFMEQYHTIVKLENQLNEINSPSRKKIWEELQAKREEVNQCYQTILELKKELEENKSELSDQWEDMYT